MQPRYLKKSDLVTVRGGKAGQRQGRYPFSATTLWRKIKTGDFPPPVTIAGIQCWPVDVLERWEQCQRKGAA